MYYQQTHRNLSVSHTQNSASRANSKPVSPHVSANICLLCNDPYLMFFKVGFYKSYGRPIAKVFLGAVFTYQFTYLAWMRLEKDEIKQQKRGMFIWAHRVLWTETDASSDELLELETELKQLSS